MTQIETLRTGKWASEKATAEEMAAKVKEIRAINEKYGWSDINVHPYGYAIPMEEFLDGFKDYRRCTSSSKGIMLSEINGLIRILNEWLKQKEEPQITIRFTRGRKAGQTKQIPESWLEDYLDLGAELVREEA